MAAGLSGVRSFENCPLSGMTPEEYDVFIDPVIYRNGIPPEVPETERVVAVMGGGSYGSPYYLLMSGIVVWSNPYPNPLSGLPLTPYLYTELNVNDVRKTRFFEEEWRSSYSEVKDLYPCWFLPSGIVTLVGGLWLRLKSIHYCGMEEYPIDMLRRIKEWLDTFAKGAINDSEAARLAQQEKEIDMKSIQIDLKRFELERRLAEETETLKKMNETRVRIARRQAFLELEQIQFDDRTNEYQASKLLCVIRLAEVKALEAKVASAEKKLDNCLLEE